MEDLKTVTAALVAALRAASIIHQNNHWLCKGPTFYGDHLLYERLYDSVSEDIDKVAEKFIGTLGGDCCDYNLQTKLLNSLLGKYADKECVEQSLAVEQDICDFIKKVYASLESNKKLTAGIDDTLSAVCSNRETSVYLLKQRIS